MSINNNSSSSNLGKPQACLGCGITVVYDPSIRKMVEPTNNLINHQCTNLPKLREELEKRKQAKIAKLQQQQTLPPQQQTFSTNISSSGSEPSLEQEVHGTIIMLTRLERKIDSLQIGITNLNDRTAFIKDFLLNTVKLSSNKQIEDVVDEEEYPRQEEIDATTDVRDYSTTGQLE